jgi:hypothetical protein
VTERAGGDGSWCTVHLFHAGLVGGTWQLGSTLTIKSFQKISGTPATGGNSTPIEGPQRRSDQLHCRRRHLPGRSAATP